MHTRPRRWSKTRTTISSAAAVQGSWQTALGAGDRAGGRATAGQGAPGGHTAVHEVVLPRDERKGSSQLLLQPGWKAASPSVRLLYTLAFTNPSTV